MTLLFIVVNVIWLLPLSALAGPGSGWSFLVTLLAYVPLVAVALLVGAGKPEEAV